MGRLLGKFPQEKAGRKGAVPSFRRISLIYDGVGLEKWEVLPAALYLLFSITCRLYGGACQHEKVVPHRLKPIRMRMPFEA